MLSNIDSLKQNYMLTLSKNKAGTSFCCAFSYDRCHFLILTGPGADVKITLWKRFNQGPVCAIFFIIL